MRIPGDIFKAWRHRNQCVIDSWDLGKRLQTQKQSWISRYLRYKRLRPEPGYHYVSLHNHSDSMGYDLEEIAWEGFKRDYSVLGVTDHNDDSKFEGKRVKCFRFGDQRWDWIALVRGAELRGYQDGEMQGDLVCLGYEGEIEPFQTVDEIARQCVRQGGFVIATNPLNPFMGGIGAAKLLDILPYVTAVEIMNASNLGFFRYADVMAEMFCEVHRMPEPAGKRDLIHAVNEEIPVIKEQDAHVLDEIGIAGFGVPEVSLSALPAGPSYVELNPQILIRQLEYVIKQGYHCNFGNYIPILSLFLKPDKIKSMSHKYCRLRPDVQE